MTDSQQDSWQKQLLLLRAVSEISDTIHEAQLVQLKYWGALAFTSKWEASIDQEKREVVYNLATKSRGNKLAAPIANLAKSVEWLLGSTWKLVVNECGKPLYVGKSISVEEHKKKARKKQRKRAEDNV